ncbi:BsuBI/PstI restriction endonuclease domain protein [Mobiluncus mulieris FB024-16]|uniref:BsuBI/PstI family type II restriction endonuclease n=2 Tax=Mobiluncus mulieris TaxID=2052 RepID=UPI0001E519DC|nr:BsuBI/PstI family type II restriction endonuclease [Mobiluncus mulieris]EFN92322.1 BsuBI/PstI restriction endonuclease domain protein [Mobiluncus mulieris FB024-16]MCU9970515.1 restriction endonuclease [Mobiluncus mulieris]MCU9995940.1 restriction endonuclease [Mobiluncus mulieris]NMW90409.1 restriction endonuclease [Mobiluncus mulieris]PNL44095.1 restriction endonuclease [Mobiluncus mulieris]
MTELNNEAYDKVEDARFILENLGMDAERSNERSALVFLSLLGIAPDSPWVSASNPMLGTRAIMDFIRDKYEKNYAPNTRETIRRFTLHQFIEALLVTQNPDKPDRPINSPNWNYQITAETLKLVHHYGQEDWSILLDDYLKSIPGIKSKYAAQREMEKIPLILPNGKNFALTPGGQNILIKSIVEEFCPRFTPGGQIIYIGDAGSKWALFEEKALSSLDVTVDEHGKMPDMVIYLRSKNWLVLIEAASSHGPVDSTRKNELSELFSSSTAGLVYVSCFPSRTEFRKYVDKIAWETDIWCADNPTHMIHYNGERFLGPYN